MITRADIFAVVFAFVLLPSLYINLWGEAAAGDSALIMMGGEEYLRVSLTNDQTINIPGKLGDSLIEIHNNSIRFVTSPCRGKQCIHSGWLNEGGEFAACLPNRISIAVSRAETRYDTINF